MRTLLRNVRIEGIHEFVEHNGKKFKIVASGQINSYAPPTLIFIFKENGGLENIADQDDIPGTAYSHEKEVLEKNIECAKHFIEIIFA